MKKWLCPELPGENAEMAREFGDFLGGLLTRRGIHSVQQAQEYFACSSLTDPFLLKDMDAAVEMIRSALDEGRKITVYGDYDCDGVTATVMLYSYLEAMGAEVEFYIPDRAEGYGMNIDALRRIIAGGTELIITVDNGISAIEEAEFLREQGIDLVITDHHQPPQDIPVCAACVDPHRADDSSPCKELCGAGMVLKLLCALEEDEEFVLEQYAELAAIGTIGDVMPLTGENRYIVRRGLENIQSCQNIGLERLLKTAGVSPEGITANSVAYYISPRINAAGRMAHADKAARLLLADSPETAMLLAEELEQLNTERRSAESTVYDEVTTKLTEHPSILSQRVIVVSGEGWHHGILGIVSAKLLERYGKPVFVIGTENGEGRGSARGIDGFSIHKLLENCSDILTKYGGHPKAGGFSLPAERIDDFIEKVNEYCRRCYPKMPVYTASADMEVSCAQLTKDNIELLSRLEPFGEGNRQPVFFIKNCTVRSKRALKDGRFTSFEAESGGAVLKALCFRIPFAEFYAQVGDRVDIMAVAELNEYNGNTSVTLKVQELRPSDFNEDRFFAAARVYEELIRGEGCDSRLAPRVIPDREALKGIYDMVRKDGGRMSAEDMCVYGGNINYCMLRIALDAFAEAGMISLAPGAERSTVIPAGGKKDLFSQGLLAELKAQLV
ncbi:MAG: single-stranded-DNA-specific exonuclease RecJ [Oscillospiraceae bacterium]|nr:single-stranded-DNA-specific exonuclease RecJ [Oscillospiraceae bacterium]